MRQCYDWENNILEFTDINDNRFLLKLKGDKTIIHGASASGKTLLCHKLKEIIDDLNGTLKPYGADNILVITRDNTDKIFIQNRKLILIDRAEQILTEQMIEFINRDNSNRYIIFLRKPMGIELSPNYFGELYQDGDGVVKIRYDFDIKGWN